MNLIDVIGQTELFHGLNAAQQDALAAIALRETYADGAVILSHDQPGESLFLVGAGQVEIRVRGRAGAPDQTPALYLGEGQLFGEVALLDAGTRSATVAAAGDETIVYRFPREALLQLCQSDTALGFIVMRNLALDLSFKLRHRNYGIEV